NVEAQLRSAEQKRQEASRQHADRFDSIVRAVEENTGAVRELAAELERNKEQDADQDGKLRELEARYAELARSQGRAGGVQSGSVAGMVGALVLAVVCALLAQQG